MSYEDPLLAKLSAPLSTFTDSKGSLIGLIQDDLEVMQHMMAQIIFSLSQKYQITTFFWELGVQGIRMFPIFL